MLEFRLMLQMFANTFLTVQEIADQSLLRLRENEVFSKLVWRDFDGEFEAKKGDTVQVRVPNTFSANDFTSTITAQDITETNVLVVLDQIADVSVALTSKQKTLNLYAFTEQVIDPAVEAIASKVDTVLAGLYVDIPYFTGTSGTTPSTLAAFADSGKILNDNKVPMKMRRGVWDPAALAEFQQLDSFVEVDKSGTNEALREGEIGRVYKIDNYMDQNIPTHTAGAFTALTDLTSDGIQAVGATTFNVESAAGSSTAAVAKGDIFTIETGDAAGQYVCTAAATAVSGDIALTIYPALRGATADTDTVAFADETAGAHVANMVFHRNAFVFANRPMDTNLGGVEAAVATFEGLSIRVTKGYSMSTKIETMSFDILYGVKTVHKELACVVLG